MKRILEPWRNERLDVTVPQKNRPICFLERLKCVKYGHCLNIDLNLTSGTLNSTDIFKDSLHNCRTSSSYVGSAVADCSSESLSTRCEGLFDDEEVKRGLVLGRKSNNEGNAIWFLNSTNGFHWTLVIFTYHLLTESEVITGKSQTEALMYWPSGSEEVIFVLTGYPVMHYVIGAVWVSEWVSVRPFLWLSGLAQGSRAGGRGSILRLDHHSRFKSNWEVSAAFVTTRAIG